MAEPGVRAVARLHARAQAEGHLTLPSLTRADLLSLGDRPAFADRDAVAWWGGLDPATRSEVAEVSQTSLLARRLVRPTDSVGEVEVHPEVQLVLAVRNAPAFVTLVGSMTSTDAFLRGYGVLGDDGALDAVLVEHVQVRGVSDFLLCSVEYAAGAVFGFLFEPPAADDPRVTEVEGPLQRVLLRRLETLVIGADHGRRHLAYAGVTAGALAPVDDTGEPGTPEQVSRESMVAMLTEEWTACAALAPRAPLA